MAGLGLTDPQMRALQAVYDLSGEARGRCDMVAPRQVAEKLWPDSPAWDRRTRRHSGAGSGAKGATMPMKAAKLLWVLHRRGFVEHHQKYSLWLVTSRGHDVLTRAGNVVPLPNLVIPRTETR